MKPVPIFSRPRRILIRDKPTAHLVRNLALPAEAAGHGLAEIANNNSYYYNSYDYNSYYYNSRGCLAWSRSRWGSRPRTGPGRVPGGGHLSNT